MSQHTSTLATWLLHEVGCSIAQLQRASESGILVQAWICTPLCSRSTFAKRGLGVFRFPQASSSNVRSLWCLTWECTKEATRKASPALGTRPCSVMMPSISLAGVTSKEGFHICSHQVHSAIR